MKLAKQNHSNSVRTHGFFKTLLAGAILAAASSAAFATTPIFDLGDGDDFALYTLGGDITIGGASSICGNIGIDPTGCSTSFLTVSGTSSFMNGGTIYAESPTSYSVSTSAKPTWKASLTMGSSVNQIVDQTTSDINTAAALATNLGQSTKTDIALRTSYKFTLETPSFTSIVGTGTTSSISLTAGNYVFNLSTVNIASNATFTLNAPAGSKVIFDITGAFTVNAGGKILLAGGISQSDVVFNLEGTNSVNINTTGSSKSEVDGSIVAPCRTVTAANTTIKGKILAQNICLTGVSVSCEYQQPVLCAQ